MKLGLMTSFIRVASKLIVSTAILCVSAVAAAEPKRLERTPESGEVFCAQIASDFAIKTENGQWKKSWFPYSIPGWGVSDPEGYGFETLTSYRKNKIFPGGQIAGLADCPLNKEKSGSLTGEYVCVLTGPAQFIAFGINVDGQIYDRITYKLPQGSKVTLTMAYDYRVGVPFRPTSCALGTSSAMGGA